MRKIFLLLIIIFISANSIAQKKSIFGQIVDKETHNPLKGASILVIGTTEGTITNDSGYFELSADYKNSIVRISYMGYKSLDIKLTKKKQPLVELEKELLLFPEMNIGLGEYNGPNKYSEPKTNNQAKETIDEFDQELDEMEEEPVDQQYTIVEGPASFFGGIDNLYAFFAANFQYPQTVLDNKLSGHAYIKFTVLPNGSISSIEYLNSGVSSEIKDEFNRIFSLMPFWKPAIQRGQNVEQSFIVNIKYSAKNYKNKP